MEYSPPPLFKQGASARFKMMVFACISIALLLADSRVNAQTGKIEEWLDIPLVAFDRNPPPK